MSKCKDSWAVGGASQPWGDRSGQISVFKASLVYKSSFSIARAVTQWSPSWKNKQTKRTAKYRDWKDETIPRILCLCGEQMRSRVTVYHWYKHYCVKDPVPWIHETDKAFPRSGSEEQQSFNLVPGPSSAWGISREPCSSAWLRPETVLLQRLYWDGLACLLGQLWMLCPEIRFQLLVLIHWSTRPAQPQHLSFSSFPIIPERSTSKSCRSKKFYDFVFIPCL